jgi:hypothetical protein
MTGHPTGDQRPTIVFSGILQEFIEPLCTEQETGAGLLHKCELGRLAWNYAIAVEYRLSVEDELHRALAEGYRRFPAMQPVIDFLLDRKETHFSGHDYFIILVQQNDRAGGPTISVEYIPAGQVESMLAKMSR